MKSTLVHMICAGLAFATGLAVDYLAKTVSARRDLPLAAIEFASEMPPAQRPWQTVSAYQGLFPADVFVAESHLTHNGYTIQKRRRKVLLEYPKVTQAGSRRVDVSYVLVKKGSKLIAKFDAKICLA